MPESLRPIVSLAQLLHGSPHVWASSVYARMGAGLVLILTVACVSTPTAPPPAGLPPSLPANPGVVLSAPPPVPSANPAPYDGHIRFIASWLPNAGPDGSKAFTNTMMLAFDCADPQATSAALHLRANTDARDIILHTGLLGWGNEGYAAIVDPDCWRWEKAFLADYLPRILALHTADEPWDVAWSYWQNGVYTPNRYNVELTTICAIVHADFPSLPCAVNVGSLPDALEIPPGIDRVWLEAYDADWPDKLATLSAKTPLPLTLMPPGFVAGDPDVLDAQKAAIVRAEWTAAAFNSRIDSFVWFLWCCDDLTTGAKDFYTVSGGHLPLTLKALQDVGAAIRPR